MNPLNVHSFGDGIEMDSVVRQQFFAGGRQCNVTNQSDGLSAGFSAATYQLPAFVGEIDWLASSQYCFHGHLQICLRLLQEPMSLQFLDQVDTAVQRKRDMLERFWAFAGFLFSHGLEDRARILAMPHFRNQLTSLSPSKLRRLYPNPTRSGVCATCCSLGCWCLRYFPLYVRPSARISHFQG